MLLHPLRSERRARPQDLDYPRGAEGDPQCPTQLTSSELRTKLLALTFQWTLEEGVRFEAWPVTGFQGGGEGQKVFWGGRGSFESTQKASRFFLNSLGSLRCSCRKYIPPPTTWHTPVTSAEWKHLAGSITVAQVTPPPRADRRGQTNVNCKTHVEGKEHRSCDLSTGEFLRGQGEGGPWGLGSGAAVLRSRP